MTCVGRSSSIISVADMTASEVQLLGQVQAHLVQFSQLVRASADSPYLRSTYRLALTSKSVGDQSITVVP